jgi:hypothetical protein
MINETNTHKKSELVNDELASAEIARLEMIKKRDRELKQKAAKGSNVKDLNEVEKQLLED